MFGLFRLWRRAPSLPGTALAMVGPRSGDEVLVLGAKDPSLAAEIGAVTRLNGRTVVMGEGAADAARTARAAEKAGALLEFVDAPLARLPFDAATFHTVVVPDLTEWPRDLCAPRLADAIRLLRPGGRIVILVGRTDRGFMGRLIARPAALAPELVVALLSSAGLLAARRLASAEGIEFYEARKRRD